MVNFNELMHRLVAALEVPNITIPAVGVTLFSEGEEVPDGIMHQEPDGMTVTSCHAIRAASLGDAVYLTNESIGCTAAAISLGFVDALQPDPLEGSRVYTEIMRENSGKGREFEPPAPRDFTEGTVYACKDAGRAEYSLFGKDDSGRYKEKDIARQAVTEMLSVHPPTMKGVFYFSPDYAEGDVVPDVVILSLRPVELCRVIQGYQFLSGKRVIANVGGLRAGCSDLIVRPYSEQDINFSPYCLGARLIARFEGDRMGMGIPFSLFKTVVQGLEESKTGFPFAAYPDAVLKE